YDEYLVEPIAKVLTTLGVKRGLVVYGQDKLDEISMNAPTTACEIRDGYYRTTVLAPEDFGLTRCEKSALVGGTPKENAAITRAILSGGEQGPRRSIVLLNAGAALYIAGKADGIADGVRLAGKLIDSGAALRTLEALREASNA
ncbi:MAG: anthranilate phosphoribosyltransferase, partial [Agathobaculum sp.]